MLEYLDCVIISYVVETRNALDLPEDQPALALFDVFAAHRYSSVLEKLRCSNIHLVLLLNTDLALSKTRSVLP